MCSFFAANAPKQKCWPSNANEEKSSPAPAASEPTPEPENGDVPRVHAQPTRSTGSLLLRPFRSTLSAPGTHANLVLVHSTVQCSEVLCTVLLTSMYCTVEYFN